MKRRALRGFGLIEIVVTIAIIAMISGAVAVGVVRYLEKARISTTRTNAQTIRSNTKTYWIDHDTATCPTVKELVAEGLIDKGKSVEKDAWGEPWRLVCEQADVTVISKGPDEQPDTEDDIREPSR
jgi:prepilin-type N-terminal cleavage/methylation domain-containing protein